MNAPRLEDGTAASGGPRAGGKRGDPASMTVLEHIAELRTTLLWALGLASAAAGLSWFFADPIVATLLRPVHEAGLQTLYFQKPMEAFMLKLKAAAVVGLFLVFPLILHRLYLFVGPGLLPREKRVVLPLLISSTLLFYGGVAFCFVILLPLVIRFALSFATEDLQPWLTAESYFDMAARLCFAFGILFELPMVVFVLSWIGVVDPRKLLRGWRYALVLILIVAAVLTPPDVISQILLAAPVMVLYMLSVVISIFVRRRRDRERDALRAQDEAEEAAEREAEAAERAAAARRAREDAGAGDAARPHGPGADAPGGGEDGAAGQPAPGVPSDPDRDDGHGASTPAPDADEPGDGGAKERGEEPGPRDER